MTAVTYELADADGNDYARLGAEEAELYANTSPDNSVTPLGKELFAQQSVGYEALLAGRAALGGFSENYHADRIMSQRLGSQTLQQMVLGPENYLG